METLLEKMLRVEFKMETLQASMLQWEAKMDALLAKAASNMDAWQSKLDAAEKSLQAQSNGIEENITDALNKQEKELQALRTTTTKTLKAAEQGLEEKEADVTLQLEAALQMFQESCKMHTVSFTANNATSSDVVIGQTIIFRTVQTNEGNGYDQKTGLFTAPYSGWYMFATTVCKVQSYPAFVQIKAAGTVIAEARNFNKNRGYICTSISGMALLREGDFASVQGGGRAVIVLTDPNLWPSFSGVLVIKM